MKPLVLLSSLAMGGAERVTVSFLRRATQDGVPVLACTVTDRHDGPLADELADAGVDRRDLQARRLADPTPLARLLALIQGEGIDVVHAHGQDASILAAAATRFTGTPLVVTRHVMEEPASLWRERVRARSALDAFRCATAAVAVSRATARRLAELTPLPVDFIRVIPNGVELDRLRAAVDSASVAERRRAVGLSPEERVLLVPAVLRDGKGHEVLLAALPRLQAEIPSLRVLFAGAGDREQTLRALAAPFGDTVAFLGERRDVPELMIASDVVVLPSRSEALPTVLLEAAAVGRPVVATRVGGIPEVVEHGKTGVLVPVDHAAALADALCALLQDPERSRVLGEAAARQAVRSFGMDRQVERTLTLWDDLIVRRAQCA